MKKKVPKPGKTAFALLFAICGSLIIIQSLFIIEPRFGEQISNVDMSLFQDSFTLKNIKLFCETSGDFLSYLIIRMSIATGILYPALFVVNKVYKLNKKNNKYINIVAGLYSFFMYILVLINFKSAIDVSSEIKGLALVFIVVTFIPYFISTVKRMIF